MNALFSVIIPVYNVAPYLRECLDSIIAAAGNVSQSDCASVEVICVNDGSTDDSGHIVDEYAKKYSSGTCVIRAYHQKNAGPSVARNLGLEVAQGEWVSFVDSDDSVTEDYFRRFMLLEHKADINFFAITRYDAFGILQTISYDTNGVVEGEAGVVSAIKRLYLNSSGTNLFGFTVNKFFRREVITAGSVRFEEGLHISEDEVFTLAVTSRIKSIQSIPYSLYRYRWLGKGLTARFRLDSGKLIRAFETIGASEGLAGVREIGNWRALREAFSAFRRSMSISAANDFLTLYRRIGMVYEGRGRRILDFLSKIPAILAVPLLVTFVIARKIPSSFPIVKENP